MDLIVKVASATRLVASSKYLYANWNMCSKIASNPNMRSGGQASAYMPAEHSIPEERSRTTLIVVVAAIAAVVIGGFFYLLLRKSVAPSPPPTLQGASRRGSPDWDKYIKLIVLDEPADCPEPGAPFCATESKRALGDIVMTLRATVRNFTGRTIIGLEVMGTVVDHQNQPVRQRTIVAIPTAEHPELSPVKTMSVSVVIDGFSDSDDRANTKMEVTGFVLR